MRRVRLGCLASIVVVGAGCGGGGPHLYTLPATRSCMTHAGYRAVALANPSLPGSGGNLRVQLATVEPLLSPTAARGAVPPGEYVYLVFADDAASARATEAKAVALTIRTLNAQGEQVTPAFVRAGVALERNVFYYSPTGPLTSGQRHKVSLCLR